MKDGTTYNQREIILIPFPYSDLTGVKLRPAVIISNQNLTGEDKLCCLITSNISSEGIIITKNSLEDKKLPFESIVKPHRIFTVNEKIIKKKISKITKEFHQKNNTRTSRKNQITPQTTLPPALPCGSVI